MSRPSNKDKILTDGLRLVHARGFGASSVRDITQAAGVPQGSFTNHFASKEAFGLEILERYREMTSAGVRATLRNDRLPPLRRLRGWIEGQLEYLRKDDMRRGCLYGNLSAEASGEPGIGRLLPGRSDRCGRAGTRHRRTGARRVHHQLSSGGHSRGKGAAEPHPRGTLRARARSAPASSGRREIDPAPAPRSSLIELSASNDHG